MKRLVIFDFDYTLCDATEGIVRSINAGLSALGRKEADTASVRATVGKTLGDSLEQLTGRPETADAKKTFIAAFAAEADRSMTRFARLFPDTVPTLAALHARGIKTAIVSTKITRRIAGILGKFGADGLVDVIIGEDDVRTAKPDPEGAAEAMRRTGASDGETVMIGDSAIDAACARNAGVDFIAVTTGTTPAEGFAGFPAIAVCSSLSEAEKHII